MAPRRIDPTKLPAGSALGARLRALAALPKVRLHHDGDEVTAVQGEPLAMSLLAAGKLTLARSVKYHRPRGPTCLRGDCDGCLVRVGGVPNVMACTTRAEAGLDVVSQNSFPSAGLDVLRVTDWFFPKHLDHHHLFVHFGGAVNRTMQHFARRMAGLGTLPDDESALPPPERATCDVLVVGAGTAGVACANALARDGLRVLLVDEREGPGGLRCDDPFAGVASPVPVAGVEVRYGASAVAAYEGETLVLDAAGLLSVGARARVFATGCREGVGTFVQNDVPGVFTARAACRALCAGVLVGTKVVVLGDGRFARGFAAGAAEAGAKVLHVPAGVAVEAAGGRAVRGVVLRDGAATRTERCDALVIDGVPAAVYELAGQAGVAVTWSAERDGFAPGCDDDGAAGNGCYVTGSLRLGRVADDVRAADGERVAARVRRDLAEGAR